jgi:hypothetical protein
VRGWRLTWDVKNTPDRLTLITSFHASGFMRSINPSRVIPD